MASAALAADVPYPAKASARDSEVLKTIFSHTFQSVLNLLFDLNVVYLIEVSIKREWVAETGHIS